MSKQIIKEFEAGERLDKTLASLYPHYSRSAIEKLIEQGQILVNNKQMPTKYKLKISDVISVDFSELEKEPEHIELPVIYEDENVVVINKPIGVLAHTKGAFSKEGTVATWLKNHVLGVIPDSDREPSQKNRADLSAEASAKEEGTQNILDSRLRGNDQATTFWSSNRAGIVHRLDRGTSGVMICTKNKEAHDYLQAQFSKRNVKKTYLAVIAGELSETEGLIDIPIERNPKKPATFRAGVNGKAAQTEFKVLDPRVILGGLSAEALVRDEAKSASQISPQTLNDKIYNLVELRPHTGRTHQLRVHLNYLKHPIVGDEFYNGEPAGRLMLHAYQLEITLPGGKRSIFTADIPYKFEEYF